MNVPNIGQGSGGVVTLPRVNPGSAPNDVQVVKVKDEVDLTSVGWFDANGDGHIDSRSSTDGGDGTLLLPAHAVYLPTYSRTVARPVAVKAAPVADAKAAAQPAVEAQPAEPPKQDVAPPTDAQTQQAVAAYVRYGQAPVSAPTDQAVA
jgi:hypothetical protein